MQHNGKRLNRADAASDLTLLADGIRERRVRVERVEHAEGELERLQWG